jgi:hypothetical protein
MGGACKKDLLNAIAACSSLTFKRRCQCFLKVDLQVTAKLTCYSQAWKQHTVAQEFEECVASSNLSAKDVCVAAEIEAVMSQMDTSCLSTLQNALTKGTTLGNSTRCDCFMEVNPTVADTVKCKRPGAVHVGRGLRAVYGRRPHRGRRTADMHGGSTTGPVHNDERYSHFNAS